MGKKTTFVHRLKSSMSCFMCGISNPLVLDFHHIHPKKKRHNVSSLRDSESIAAEAKKCLPVCANCHRKLHAR